MAVQSFSHKLNTLGVIFTFSGMLSYFQLERQSYYSSAVDLESRILELVFLPALVIGLLMALSGTVLWARRAASRQSVTAGVLRAMLKPRLSLVTENLALRQQLVILRRNTSRPGLVIEIACFGLSCRICGATGAPS